MKNQLQILIAIAIILIGTIACQKSTKDRLVGTWHCNGTCTGNFDFGESEKVSGTMKFNGIQVFNQDGTYSAKGNGLYDFKTEAEDGTPFKVKMSVILQMNGEWNDKESSIMTIPTSIKGEVVSMEYYNLDGSLVGELPGSELEEMSKGFMSSLQSGLFEASIEKITKYNDDEFVTEEFDEEISETITTTYTRIK